MLMLSHFFDISTANQPEILEKSVIKT